MAPFSCSHMPFCLPTSPPPSFSLQEEPKAEAGSVSEKDIDVVAKQAGVSRERAIAALKKTNGDLVNALMVSTPGTCQCGCECVEEKDRVKKIIWQESCSRTPLFHPFTHHFLFSPLPLRSTFLCFCLQELTM